MVSSVITLNFVVVLQVEKNFLEPTLCSDDSSKLPAGPPNTLSHYPKPVILSCPRLAEPYPITLDFSPYPIFLPTFPHPRHQVQLKS